MQYTKKRGRHLYGRQETMCVDNLYANTSLRDDVGELSFLPHVKMIVWGHREEQNKKENGSR